jgi:hypothetical protein
MPPAPGKVRIQAPISSRAVTQRTFTQKNPARGVGYVANSDPRSLQGAGDELRQVKSVVAKVAQECLPGVGLEG